MTTLLLVCGALARDVRDLSDKYGWDVRVAALPPQLHNRPERIPDAVRRKIEALRNNFDRVMVLYGDCGTGGELDRTLSKLGVDRIEGPHCYEQYAGGKQFHDLMEEEPGTFFLTDFLARSFDRLVVQGLGIDRNPELQEAYFGNYKRMVYLQQRPDESLLRKAQTAAARLGLPLEVRNTGFGKLETRLSRRMLSSDGPGTSNRSKLA
jgi:hypothetical protein